VISADRSVPDRQPSKYRRGGEIQETVTPARTRASSFLILRDCDRPACRCVTHSKRTPEFFARNVAIRSRRLAMLLRDISERPYHISIAPSHPSRGCSCHSRITAAITRPFNSAPSQAPIAQCANARQISPRRRNPPVKYSSHRAEGTIIRRVL